jgi:hypothetical protein
MKLRKKKSIRELKITGITIIRIMNEFNKKKKELKSNDNGLN